MTETTVNGAGQRRVQHPLLGVVVGVALVVLAAVGALGVHEHALRLQSGATARRRARRSRSRPDDAIAREIRAALAAHPGLSDNLVLIAVDDGVVALRGQLSQRRQQQLIAVVREVDGVRRVHARLTRPSRGVPAEGPDVRGPIGSEPAPRSDGAPGAQARQGQQRSAVDRSGAGRDQPAASVPEQQSGAAAAVARPQPARSDAEIAAAVRRGLAGQTELAPLDIQLSVDGGTVHLAGEVGSVQQRRLATAVVAAIPGVRVISNDLAVTGAAGTTTVEQGKTDEEIAADLRDALVRADGIDDERISIRVERGIVTLIGYVDDSYALQLAEVSALEAGARGVRNLLEIGGPPR